VKIFKYVSLLVGVCISSVYSSEIRVPAEEIIKGIYGISEGEQQKLITNLYKRADTIKDCLDEEKNAFDAYTYLLLETQGVFTNLLKIKLFACISSCQEPSDSGRVITAPGLLRVIRQKLNFLSEISAELEEKSLKTLKIDEISKISNHMTSESCIATWNNIIGASDFFKTYPFLIPLGIKIFGENFHKNLTLLFHEMWNEIKLGKAFVANTNIQEEFCMNFKTAVSELQNLISREFPEK